MASLSEDLIEQARHLANLDPFRPKQANLRRAVSSAYYGLFHLLVEEASTRMTPRRPSLLASRVGRTLSQGEMADVCRSVLAVKSSAILHELLPRPFTQQLREFARTFILLQEIRHSADYDLTLVVTRSSVNKLLVEVGRATAAWQAIRKSEEATVFLAALLFARRWGR